MFLLWYESWSSQVLHPVRRDRAMSCRLGVWSESFVMSHPPSSWVSKDYSSNFHDMGRKRCLPRSMRRYGSSSLSVEMPPERLVQSRSSWQMMKRPYDVILWFIWRHPENRGIRENREFVLVQTLRDFIQKIGELANESLKNVWHIEVNYNRGRLAQWKSVRFVIIFAHGTAVRNSP